MQKILPITLLSICLSVNAFASLQDTASALDETINRVNLDRILPGLAEKVGVDLEIAKVSLVEKTNKLSDLALAKFVSDKTGEKVESLLDKGIQDWTTFFGKNSSAEKEADEYLDMLQTDVALMMLDYREGRKK